MFLVNYLLGKKGSLFLQGVFYYIYSGFINLGETTLDDMKAV